LITTYQLVPKQSEPNLLVIAQQVSAHPTYS